MATSHFYQDLPAFSDFAKAFHHAYYQSVPDDWWVVVADIVGSTKAIEAGLYKTVNFVGSLPIISVLNLLNPVQFPYVFGGDGATLLVANRDKARVLEILIATAQIARSVYGLEYRLGAIQIAQLRQQGSDVKIAKFNVSKHYQQAFFMGGGLSLADSLVKKNLHFQIDTTQETRLKPDFSGLECRWQDISNERGKVICLLIEGIDNKADYKTILQRLETIAGDKKQRSAVHENNLTLSFSPKKLQLEAKLASFSTSVVLRMATLLLENVIGKFLMGFSIQQWGGYKENVLQTTDSEKFDDMLRMVIAVTETQQKQIVAYLEQQYQAGQLIYGVHSSDRALMTCLIFERHGQQVHFVDAADGGYALAAKAFKRRKQALPNKIA